MNLCVSSVSDEYLAFSPSVITHIFDYLRSTIGTSVNIGMVIFFFVIGICITINIVRYFSAD